MFAWWNLLILLGWNLSFLLADLRFVYYFMHRDDFKYKQGILAQIVAVVGLQFVWLMFCILPSDVYNTLFDAGFDMLYFWNLVYLVLVLYLTLILPYATLYYQADSDPRLSKTAPWKQAIKGTLISATCSWLFIVIVYLIVRKVEVEVSTTRCIRISPGAPSESSTCMEYETYQETVTGNLRFLDYLIAIIGLVGWLPLAFLGAVGLASVPVGLVYGFINRTRPSSQEQYEERKRLIGERAKLLREIGEALMVKETQTHGWGKKMQFKSHVSKFKQVVTLLETDFAAMEKSFNERGDNLFFVFLKLGLGIIASILTIAWLAQIIVVLIIPQVSSTAGVLHNLLGDALLAMAKWKTLIVDLLFYSILCSYVMVCIFNGNIRVCAKIGSGILPVEPLKKSDTHLNSLLFHIGMFVTGAAAIQMLAEECFRGYTDNTDAEKLFALQRHNLKLFRSLYGRNVFVWILLVLFLIWAVVLVIFPKNKPLVNLDNPKQLAKWRKLQKDLGVQEDQAGAVKKEDIAAAKKHEKELANAKDTSTVTKIKDKMTRMDQKVEKSPGEILGTAARGAMRIS